MYVLEIEQEHYIKARFVFRDLEEATALMKMLQKSAATETTIRLICVAEAKGEEDDNN